LAAIRGRCFQSAKAVFDFLILPIRRVLTVDKASSAGIVTTVFRLDVTSFEHSASVFDFADHQEFPNPVSTSDCRF
jgi:hypothetical protein